jgi:hypothetical protein
MFIIYYLYVQGHEVEGRSTTFDDLVPVCPSCHRAVHRFYDNWLDSNNRKDFISGGEAKSVYQELKSQFTGLNNMIVKSLKSNSRLKQQMALLAKDKRSGDSLADILATCRMVI